ncbi:MAG TPA: potassium-transporting ATPase subunit KdpA [Acidimicrobiia bacterium]|nr:potassium-transporting ATPase subunit KdpA [Acidimicrobiia bacterium]
MPSVGWLQLGALAALVIATTPLLGSYLAKVFMSARAPGDRVLLPLERLVYRIVGVDPHQEQRWDVYARSVLAFSAVSVFVLYVLQRVQGSLPFDPTGADAVPPALAWNTAVSFTTNTNWQSYAGESTMSHLTQMAGLAVQNFASAAVGLAVAIALVRGLVRRRAATIGNFWVDLTRGVTRVLVPLAFVAALFMVSQGVVQNLSGSTEVHTLDGATQSIPGGPVASQEAIKALGTNGGGFFNANSAHPFENPGAGTNLLQLVLLLAIPFALTYTFGTLAGRRRQGWVVFAAMFVLWAGSAVVAMTFESDGNARLDERGVTQETTGAQGGGNLEGKEVRFGATTSALYAASTTGTSAGAVISSHDSYTPGGGAVPLVNMMLGEVSPGGVGAGLYGMLVFVLLAVFIAGLMVGRTPEFLGKRIQAPEMKLVVLYVLAAPVAVLVGSAASVLLRNAKASILNAGAHGLSEIVYAFTSAANNNGSAFGGLDATGDWFTTTLAIAMLVGRFALIVPVLAIAGSLAAKQSAPPSAGTFPTDTPLFTGLLVGVIVIVVGLTFFPAIALGALVEGLR